MTDQLSLVFAALADPVRRSLVSALTGGEASVGQLAVRHPISVQAVSKHIQVLESAGLVARVGVGHRRTVRLIPEPLAELEIWLERHRRRAESRYRRLDDLLAEQGPAGTTDLGGQNRPQPDSGPDRREP